MSHVKNGKVVLNTKCKETGNVPPGFGSSPLPPWDFLGRALPNIVLEVLLIWSWNCSSLATSCEELTHWKRLWCWEGLGAGGEGDDRGWDGWMASPTQWTWVSVNSGSWWWTGRPGVLWFMWSQRVGHDWTTELNWENLLSDITFFSPALILLLLSWETFQNNSKIYILFEPFLLVLLFNLRIFEII